MGIFLGVGYECVCPTLMFFQFKLTIDLLNQAKSSSLLCCLSSHLDSKFASIGAETHIETLREQNLSGATSSSYVPVHVFEHFQGLCVRTRLTLFSYSSHFPISLSFCSSSSNHSLSMHSIHFLLNLEL